MQHETYLRAACAGLAVACVLLAVRLAVAALGGAW